MKTKVLKSAHPLKNNFVLPKINFRQQLKT